MIIRNVAEKMTTHHCMAARITFQIALFSQFSLDGCQLGETDCAVMINCRNNQTCTTIGCQLQTTYNGN